MAKTSKQKEKEVVESGPPANLYLYQHLAYMNVHVNTKMKGGGDPLVAHMTKDIFGEECTDYLNVDEINEVLQHGWLGASVISIYIRYFKLFTLSI